MKKKYQYIHTIGCQMNVYDSDQIAGRLKLLGYEKTLSMEKADLIILNTCAIREKAEQKVFSFLGRLSRFKRKKPSLIIGVGGCVAQQEGEKILKRVPHLDLVFGTHAVDRLERMIRRIENKRCRIIDIKMEEENKNIETKNYSSEDRKTSRFVTIMQGCDNYCTYCVVPYVRGREKSRKPEDIFKEVKYLVKRGAREVTLLGQNVNSYGIKEGLCSFTELLSYINGIEGLLRIRFTTSHPKDLSPELIHAFGDLNKLCHHIHLPVQSGSNKILKKMNRKYTREQYIEKIYRLREVCPDIAITSDFIVGFPGESKEDFKKTLELINQVEFDGLFAFKYSDRPNAPAARFQGKISEDEKKERLQSVLCLQDKFTIKKNESLLGTHQEVLVEGFSKKQTTDSDSRIPGYRASLNENIQWTGRTTTNKIVNFSQEEKYSQDTSFEIGSVKVVRINRAFAHSLWGVTVCVESPINKCRKEGSYAA